MTNFRFGRLWELLLGVQVIWIILWVGLLFLLISLLVLMWSSWGQSQVLRKCVVLSLVAHVLVAVYMTTVQIVATSHIPGNGEFRVALVEGWADGAGEPGPPDEADPWTTAPPDATVGTTVVPATENTAQSVPESTSPRADLTPAIAKLRDAANAAPAAAAALAARLMKATEPTSSPPTQAVADSAPPATADSDPAGPRPGAGSSDVADSQAKPPLPPDSSATNVNDPPLRSVAAADTNPTTDSTAAANGAENRQVSTPLNTNAAGPTGMPAVGTGDGTDHQIPDVYKGRFAADRIGIIQRQGGTLEAEASVQAALKFLAANQTADGHWEPSAGAPRDVVLQNGLGSKRLPDVGARADTGITGLALLSFLAAGHTHQQGEYRETVQRGLEFLLRSQGMDGNLGGPAEPYAFMYCHAMSTLALSEAYAITADKRLDSGVRRAIGYTLRAQNSFTGGWRYRPGEEGDTSQLGWQVMALKSAELAGIPIPGRTRDGISQFLTSVSSGSFGGLASYRPHERTSRPMTAEALACREFMNLPRSSALCDEAGDYLMQELPGTGPTNVYYWYYATLSTYQLQGRYWQRWNQALQPVLIKSQVPDGTLAGSWNPDAVCGDCGGRVFSTALSALCLEVCYRFLPLYGQDRTVAERLR